MGDVKLISSGGGSVTLTTPSTASTYTQTLQAATGTIPVAATSGTFTTANFNSASTFGFKNRLINGAMVVDQRNGGAAVTLAANTFSYTVDRWQVSNNRTNGTTLVVQQDFSSAPNAQGFNYDLKFTNTTGGVTAALDTVYFIQPIEAYNTNDLAWGTASAVSVTVSFWVKCSLNGTFALGLRNAAANRSYVATYSIPVANTWTYVSVIVPGDTSGTWAGTNGIGIWLSFDLGVGSTYNTSTYSTWQSGNYVGGSTVVKLSNTTGATFQITGVQLESGSVATGFDYRPIGTEIMLCQRYYEVYDGARATGTTYTGNGDTRTAFSFREVKRASPTLTQSGSLVVIASGETSFVLNVSLGTITLASLPNATLGFYIGSISNYAAFTGCGQVISWGDSQNNFTVYASAEL